MTESAEPFNRSSIFSFDLALFALLVFCAGMQPIPFTFLFCYPPGVVIAVTSFVLGIKARREHRTDAEHGEFLANLVYGLVGYVCMLLL